MHLSFIQNYRLLWALLIILGLSSGAQAQYVQTKSVVDSAGGSSKASGYTNISAIGQPFNFNEGSNGGYNNRGGFLHGGILLGGGGVVSDVDTDGDGLTDIAEIEVHKTNPNIPDSDGDGFSDGTEVAAGSNLMDSNSIPKNNADLNPSDLLWSLKTGGPVFSAPAMGIDGTTVFGSDDNKLYAVDKFSVKIRWEFKGKGEFAGAPSISKDGTAFYRMLSEQE